MSAAVEETRDSVVVRAPAKVNLFLGVGAPREDGFHPLATVYQAVGLYDDVTATSLSPEPAGPRGRRARLADPGPAGDGGDAADPDALDPPGLEGLETDPEAGQVRLSVTVDDHVDSSGVPLDERNIVVAAARALTTHHGLPASALDELELHVAKSIPVAGGLAGGSADAAATLVALDRLWELETPDDELLALAGELGSDVPFALLGGSALGTSRGEHVEPVQDDGAWWWVLVPAEGGLSTPEVYRHHDELRPGAPARPVLGEGLLEALATGSPEALARVLHNDLQEAALDLRPDLADVLETGERAGALRGIVSGSGPTCVFLCADASAARETAGGLREAGYAPLLATAAVAGAHRVAYAPGGVPLLRREPTPRRPD